MEYQVAFWLHTEEHQDAFFGFRHEGLTKHELFSSRSAKLAN